jgi:hypothetical protein
MKEYLINRKTLCWELSSISVKATSQEEAIEKAKKAEGTFDHDEYNYEVEDELSLKSEFNLLKGYEDNLYPVFVFKKDKFYLLHSQNDLNDAANHFNENAYNFTEDFGNRSIEYVFVNPQDFSFPPF